MTKNISIVMKSVALGLAALIPFVGADLVSARDGMSGRTQGSPLQFSFIAEALAVRPLLETETPAKRVRANLIRDVPHRLITAEDNDDRESNSFSRGNIEQHVAAAPAPAMERGRGGKPPNLINPDSLLESLVSGSAIQAEHFLQQEKLRNAERFNDLIDVFPKWFPGRHFKVGDVIISWTGNAPPQLGWVKAMTDHSVVVSQYEDLVDSKAEWKLSESNRHTYLLTNQKTIHESRIKPSWDVGEFIADLPKRWEAVPDPEAEIHKKIPGLADAKLMHTGNWNIIFHIPGQPSEILFEYGYMRLTREQYLLIPSLSAQPIVLPGIKMPDFKWAPKAARLTVWPSTEALRELRRLHFTSWVQRLPFSSIEVVIRKRAKAYMYHLRSKALLWLIGVSISLSLLVPAVKAESPSFKKYCAFSA